MSAVRHRPQTRQVLSANVLRTEWISPNFVRVTAGGGALGELRPVGYDQWFRLFVPNTPNGALHLPTDAADWWNQYLAITTDDRPIVRNYTVRAYRPAGSGRFGDAAELDIDFLTHDPVGPGASWAANVGAGGKLALLDEGTMYQGGASIEGRQLIVGDESALPAIAGILTSAPALRADVLLEVGHTDDIVDLVVPPEVEVQIVTRDDGRRYGDTMVEAVTKMALANRPTYAFIAGETTAVGAIRRHLIDERGMTSDDVTFTGYWKFKESVGYENY